MPGCWVKDGDQAIKAGVVILLGLVILGCIVIGGIYWTLTEIY